ncbi:unnamed protein product [Tuber aestivum]|uniref:Uncharacterized protein n=1 Tax=Tuber aestivum TaxID=59557 RepID=A0A292PN60_9PEZI|nr:unnamed protein product [Tuber aestivum]
MLCDLTRCPIVGRGFPFSRSARVWDHYGWRFFLSVSGTAARCCRPLKNRPHWMINSLLLCADILGFLVGPALPVSLYWQCIELNLLSCAPRTHTMYEGNSLAGVMRSMCE